MGLAAYGACLNDNFCALQVILPLIIFAFGPVSGAHFNPMVTTVMVLTGLLVSLDLALPAFLCTVPGIIGSHAFHPSHCLLHGGRQMCCAPSHIKLCKPPRVNLLSLVKTGPCLMTDCSRGQGSIWRTHFFRMLEEPLAFQL